MIPHPLHTGTPRPAIAFGFAICRFAEILPNRSIYLGLYAISAIIFVAGFGILWKMLAAERRREKYPVQE